MVIDPVVRADQGTYSCMAGNSVGSMTTDAFLTVETSNLDTLDTKINPELLKGIVNEASKNIDRYCFLIIIFF